MSFSLPTRMIVSGVDTHSQQVGRFVYLINTHPQLPVATVQAFKLNSIPPSEVHTMCLQQPTLWVWHTVNLQCIPLKWQGYTYWTSDGLCFIQACLTWRRSTYQKRCNFLMCTTKNGVLCLHHNFHKDTAADEVLWHTLQGERGCGGREGGRKREAEEEEVILQPHPSSLLLLRQKGKVVMLIDLFLNC